MRAAFIFVLVLLASCRASPPDGVPGIGFDDMHFSKAHGLVLVPSGRSGFLNLVDPATRRVQSIDGFSKEIFFFGGGYQGVTSADDGPAGLIYASDRTPEKLHVVDPAAGAIIATRQVASGFDYVRFVAPMCEVWMTEPDDDRIEIFSVGPDPRIAPEHVAYLATPGGPESLVVDATRGRAYTHLWNGATYSIDVHSRAIVATWPNGCSGSRGIDLDEARGFLFAGCSEGTAVVLDVAHDGKQLSTLKSGSGVDVIAYSKSLGHLYLPGASSQTMAIVGVSAKGALSLLGVAATAKDAHCVTADASGNAYECDPGHGQLLKYKDAYPSSQ